MLDFVDVGCDLNEGSQLKPKRSAVAEARPTSRLMPSLTGPPLIGELLSSDHVFVLRILHLVVVEARSPVDGYVFGERCWQEGTREHVRDLSSPPLWILPPVFFPAASNVSPAPLGAQLPLILPAAGPAGGPVQNGKGRTAGGPRVVHDAGTAGVAGDDRTDGPENECDSSAGVVGPLWRKSRPRRRCFVLRRVQPSASPNQVDGWWNHWQCGLIRLNILFHSGQQAIN
ncbi:hypothetical protein GW17_00021646 [Ensete ventricosum]|nr:hypothetical protein GW17_00021646 [Ensete ventricosum]